MSLLAEVVVEEWLNRQGYFTIRGVKLGVDEIDLLAIKPCPDGTIERRHIEVQASVRPIGYICQVPKQVQKETGRGANSNKMTHDELKQGVQEWVEKKFKKEKKNQLRQSLGQGTWTFELVINNVKPKKAKDENKAEVSLIEDCGVHILQLRDIVQELRATNTLIKAASGADLLDLMHLASSDSLPVNKAAEIIAGM